MDTERFLSLDCQQRGHMGSKVCSEPVFKSLIAKYPYLCSIGLMTKEYSQEFHVYFEASRNALLKEYRAFTLALDWLESCRAMNVATETSPKSADLCSLLGKFIKTSIPQGAFIAAALYLGIPYFRVEGTSYLHIGISKFSPNYQALLHQDKKI